MEGERENEKFKLGFQAVAEPDFFFFGWAAKKL
jgi:hypothetical protein